MARVLLVFGTRPEIIKMASVYKGMAKLDDVDVEVFWSRQHIELADGLASFFQIPITHKGSDLSQCASLPQKFGQIVQDLAAIIQARRYDWIVVQGDTTTAAAGAITGFLNSIPVAHVEAGLRTWDLHSPWPEEFNRRLISLSTVMHFPPTQSARDNLLAEGVEEGSIHVTGNTVIDALKIARRRIRSGYRPHDPALSELPADRKLILVTGHRRENFGRPMRNLVEALRTLAADGDKTIVFPVHLNPGVRRTVFAHLAGCENIHLLQPLRYPDFVYLLERAWTVVTDSGGIQEEAPSFHRPIVITRESTERPEVVEAGFGRLVGSDPRRLVETVREFTRGENPAYIRGSNPFGAGNAGKRIAERLMAPLTAKPVLPRRLIPIHPHENGRPLAIG